MLLLDRYTDCKIKIKLITKNLSKNSNNSFNTKYKIESIYTIKVEDNFSRKSLKCQINFHKKSKNQSKKCDICFFYLFLSYKMF
jgi:hypothetical protein